MLEMFFVLLRMSKVHGVEAPLRKWFFKAQD